MWADGPVMEVQEGFGKRVPVLAEAADWQLPQFKHPERCRVSVFRAHQTAQEKRRPRGLSEKNTQCPGWWGIYFSRAKSERWLVQIRFLLFCQRGSETSPRSEVYSAGWAELSGLSGWVKRGEGGAEIREDGADGSGNLSAQVSLFHLNRPVQLHRRDATTATQPTHGFDAQCWQQDE